MRDRKASNGAILRETGYGGGYASGWTDFELISGDWPSDDELIKLANDGLCCPLGGRIENRSEKKLRAVFYTD